MTSENASDAPVNALLKADINEELVERVKRELATISPFIADCFCLIEAPGEGVLNFDLFFRDGIFLGHSQPGPAQKGSWLFENVFVVDQPALHKLIRKVLFGATCISELKIKDVNGAERQCRVTGKPLWNANGSVVSAGILIFSEIETYRSGAKDPGGSINSPAIIDSVLGNFVITDSAGRVISFSGNAKKLLRVSADENLSGRNFLDFFSPAAKNYPIVGNEDYREFEMQLRENGSGDAWLLVCSFPVVESSASRGSNFVVLNDITSAKLSQSALVDSEEKFRALAENCPGTIFLEIDQRIVYVNSRVEEDLGFSAEEITSADFRPAQIFSDYQKIAELKAELNAKKETELFPKVQRELIIARKDGTSRRFVLSVQSMPFRGRNAYLGIMTDVTDLNLVSQRLSETRKRYWALFEAASDSIFLETLDGTVLDCNSAALNTYGYSREEMMGMNARELVPGDFNALLNSLEEELEKPGNHDRSLNVFSTGRKKDGTIFPTEVNINRLELEGEELYLVTIRDISLRRELETARKKYDNQLQQIQLLDSFTNVVSGLSNDFNNILTGIMGYADLILRDISPASPAREKARKILDAARKGGEIIQQLVTSTGKLPSNFQKSNIVKVVKELLPGLTEMLKSKGSLSLIIDDNTPEIYFDAAQIKLAIESLIKNSFEAVEENGRFVLSIVRGTRKFTGSETGYFGPPFNAGTYLEIKVGDNGGGIQVENLSRIFEPFFSTRYSNRGLGLSTVLGIVRSHRGSIFVDSKPGSGSEFTLLLPCLNEENSKEEFSSRPIRKPFPAGSVLVVDDDESVAEVLCAHLKSLGYEVFRASDGLDGIEQFKRLNRKLSLVILDLAMPGKTGVEVLQELRWLNPEMPVIICTGLYDVSQNYEQYGISAVLYKPFQLIDIEKALLRIQINK
ncbi:MAG: hypothetical protein PWR01_2683 [Clostridiales bacterium]|nr:hypothetical protein [Clostridiales bacterium]MDN5281610.1 hypothetical protein [Candidatus Ozemobacter sp.]